MDPFKCTGMLEKALDAASLRQQVISNNIANVNTYGFKPSAVAFEDQLKKALASQEAGENFRMVSDDPELALDAGSDMKDLKPAIQQQEGKVDVNQEMVQAAKNQILYSALTQKISGYLSSLTYVIDNHSK